MTWQQFIKQEQAQPYYSILLEKLKLISDGQIVYPPKDDIFNAFKLTPLNNVKCVILGQDPYINENQAHGLAFSVRKGNPIPPSLKNIYKELQSDLGVEKPSHGCLEAWAKQGVLLLNSVLTVQAHNSNSHATVGWHIFTDNAIRHLTQQNQPIVYLLWGSLARSKKELITKSISKYLIIESPHPSPLSAHQGFFGSKPFSRANKFLEENGQTPINWSINE